MSCEHDLSEREVACADGMCPLCLAADLGEARKDTERIDWMDKMQPHISYDGRWFFVGDGQGPTLQDAIDAALAKESAG